MDAFLMIRGGGDGFFVVPPQNDGGGVGRGLRNSTPSRCRMATMASTVFTGASSGGDGGIVQEGGPGVSPGLVV